MCVAEDLRGGGQGELRGQSEFHCRPRGWGSVEFRVVMFDQEEVAIEMRFFSH